MLSKYLSKLRAVYRSVIISVFIFFLIGFFYALNKTPLYEVSLAINQNNEESQGINPNTIVSLALGQNAGNASKFYYELSEAMYSMEVTKNYQENHDGLKNFYGGYLDEKLGEYSPIWNTPNRLAYLKFSLLGVDYNPVPNLYLLNSFIKGSISVNYDEFADLIYINSLTDAPAEISKLIEDILKETDDYFKVIESNKIKARIIFLNQELVSTSSIAQRDAISSILQAQLLKLSLTGTDEFYKIKIIRNLESSEHPVQPNILFLLALFSMFGFMLSVGFHTALFARDEFSWSALVENS